ncbi:hypothetical protein J5N97_020316 [Dioscorea zingiberensis]|uniref:Uncharacterized protein n=1 Tax=Dioscorea zingiberensis TaxID=325984 RepID=A0A9D5CGR5_9LILI|nr:hypothetical protein J5N97_020316 [Dioscorea zingiberensis]
MTVRSITRLLAERRSPRPILLLGPPRSSRSEGLMEGIGKTQEKKASKLHSMGSNGFRTMIYMLLNWRI